MSTVAITILQNVECIQHVWSVRVECMECAGGMYGGRGSELYSSVWR